MGTAQRNQQAFGGRIAEYRHIGAQRLAERPLEWVRVVGQRRAGRRRRGEELFALGAVTWLGGEVCVHACLLLIFCPVCCPRPYRKCTD
ncbi:hypothetical protein D3C87_1548880 [compost metagenome]